MILEREWFNIDDDGKRPTKIGAIYKHDPRLAGMYCAHSPYWFGTRLGLFWVRYILVPHLAEGIEKLEGYLAGPDRQSVKESVVLWQSNKEWCADNGHQYLSIRCHRHGGVRQWRYDNGKIGYGRWNGQGRGGGGSRRQCRGIRAVRTSDATVLQREGKTCKRKQNKK